MPLSQSSHKHVDLGSEHVVFGRPAPAQPVPIQASSLRALVLSGLSSESIVRFAAARQSSPQIGSRWRWTAGTSLGRQRPAARPFDRTPGPKRRAEIPCCGRETQCWVLRRRELMLYRVLRTSMSARSSTTTTKKSKDSRLNEHENLCLKCRRQS